MLCYELFVIFIFFVNDVNVRDRLGNDEFYI